MAEERSSRIDWSVAVAAGALAVSAIGSAASFTGDAAAETKRNDEQDRRIARVESDQRAASDSLAEVNIRLARMEGKIDVIARQLDRGSGE